MSGNGPQYPLFSSSSTKSTTTISSTLDIIIHELKALFDIQNDVSISFPQLGLQLQESSSHANTVSLDVLHDLHTTSSKVQVTSPLKMVMTELSSSFTLQLALLFSLAQEGTDQGECVPDENRRYTDGPFLSGVPSVVGEKHILQDGLEQDDFLLQVSVDDDSIPQNISASPLQDYCDKDPSMEGEEEVLELADESIVDYTLMSETSEGFDEGDHTILQDHGLEVYELGEVDDLGLEIYNDTLSTYDDAADDLDMLEEYFDEGLENEGVVAFIQQKRLSASSEDEGEFAIEAKRARLVI